MQMPSTWRRLLVLAFAAGIVSANRTDAGWVSVRNDTKQTLLIQEVPATLGGKPGRCIRLLPGECVREFHAKPGEKRINVLDPSQPSKPLCQAKLVWVMADLTLRVRTENAVVRLIAPAGTKPDAVVDLAKATPVAK